MLFTAGSLLEIAALGFWLFSLFDVITTPPEQVRNLQKVVWVVIVLLGFEVIGAAFWFVYGRPKSRVAATTSGPRVGGSRRSMAPDDDIDFLRSLNKPRDDGDAAAR